MSSSNAMSLFQFTLSAGTLMAIRAVEEAEEAMVVETIEVAR
jgi:hypothetical protein